MHIQIQQWDLLPYAEAMQLQEKFHAEVSQTLDHGVIMFLEHPPVLTLGKNGAREHVLASAQELRDEKIELLHVDRGGEVTAHEPGQLVVYPILPLREMHLGVREYVTKLEQILIDFLSEEYGVASSRNLSFPGVWVGNTKIASIGVRIKERVTYHGLALNIANDLKLFAKITPCGISDCQMVTLSQVLGRNISVAEVRNKIIARFKAF